MNNSSKYSGIVFYLVCCVYVLSASPAFANPGKLTLSFDYWRSGGLAVDVKFDSPATSRCTARHKVSLYHEGKVLGDEGVIRSTVFNRVVPIGRTSSSLRAFKLLGAKKKSNKDPIMAIQTKLECPNEPDIYSNIVARYVRCGDDTARLSLPQFLNSLRRYLE